VKLFFVILSIVSSLKNVIIPLEKFDRVKTLELFGKVYDQLPNQPATKEKFLESIDKWLSLYILIVNIVWEFKPDIFHKLAWTVVGAEQSAWLSVVEKVQKYLKGYFVIDDEINQKANSYIHAYNLKVLDALLDKDCEVERKEFDYQCTRSINRLIEELKAKMHSDSEEDSWYMYVDHSGIHINKGKEVIKWTGTK